MDFIFKSNLFILIHQSFSSTSTHIKFKSYWTWFLVLWIWLLMCSFAVFALAFHVFSPWSLMSHFLIGQQAIWDMSFGSSVNSVVWWRVCIKSNVVMCGYHGFLCVRASGCMNISLCVLPQRAGSLHRFTILMSRCKGEAQSSSPQFTRHVMHIKLIKMQMEGTFFFTVSV